jgi:hypothetical protein
MTQKQNFLKNIVDSTLSIPLEYTVYDEKMQSFSFNSKTIIGNINKFVYKLSGSETAYSFDIMLHRNSKRDWFGSDKSEYYLRVETRKLTKYTNNYISTDFFSCKESNKELLKKVFDFLFNRIEEKRFAKEEENYEKINLELVKLIDKSLTRDEKLKDLLF